MQGNRPLVLLLALIALAGVIYTLQVSGDPEKFPRSGIPSRVVMVNGYRELHVDDKPFFMHSAAFYYYRMPRDRWEEALLSYKQHGINTIDLYVIWNWHQPAEDSLDLDGSANPRRDLKGLLKLLSDLGFKVSVRPGPFVCSEWKNGGYPDWLLTKPEFQRSLKPEHQMPLKDVLEGRYPALSALQYEFSEEAADAWLQNPTHLQATRKWYEDVMGVVRPYLASRGGNVILLQVDDDQAVGRYNYNGPRFWQYMNLLRKYLREAARDKAVPIYFNPADMRVTASASDPLIGEPFWAMGQYYQEEGYGSDVLSAEDSSDAKFLAEILKTQRGFPPFFIEYQAGWFAGAEDVRARATDPTNTLISSRFLIQNGVRGINYFPLQETLFPAGYECPWSNYFYSWESAIGYEGDLRPRAEASLRNGRLIQGMGRLLAASHYAADIGIAHTIGSYPQERLTREDVDGVRFRTLAATQFAFFNQVNAELVDLDYEGLPELRRYRMILLPVPTGSMYKDGKVPEYMRLSNRAQRLLAAYVQEGGIVVAYPEPPKGADLQPLFPPWNGTEPNEGVRAAPLSIGNASGYQNKFGKGSAIVLQSEFDRWVPLRSVTSSPESPLPNQPVLSVLEKRAAGRILEGLLDTAGIKRGALSPGLEKGLALQQPYLSLLVANAPAESGKGHSFGFLSITNFATGPYRFQVLVRDPRTGENLTLPPLEVGGRDALLLPLRVGLKELGFTGADGQKTNDEIYYSTAELTSVRSESGALLIDLYSKGKASLRLRLNREPTGAPTAGGEILERRYYPATRILDVDIPAPKDSTGRQTLRIPYELLKGPHAPSEETGQPRVDIRPTPRIPVRFDVAYDLLPATRFATIGETVEFSFTHPFDCTNKCKARVSADDLVVSQVDPEKTPSFTVRVPLERTYVRKLEWTLENNGKTYKGEGRIVFYPPGSAVAVECDVDRDGFTDYILENEKLRLILFPHAGARSFALVRKDTNSSAFTSIGGLRDLFRVQMPDPPKHDRLPAWTRRGLPGMHNRFYEGRIVQESGEYAEVAFSYQAPDVAPSGALLERSVRLAGNADYFDVTYKITPNDTESDQGYINLSSVALGSMEGETDTVLRSDASGEAGLRKRTQGSIAGATWVALARRDFSELFGMSWAPGTFEKVGYDRRDFSLLLQPQSPPWKRGEKSHTYRVRYYYGPDSPQAYESLRLLNRKS